MTVQHVQADTFLSRNTNEITNALGVALSLFGWHSITPKLAVPLGASLLTVGDGQTEFWQLGADGTVTEGSYGNGQGVVELDIYPGVTYQPRRMGHEYGE